MHLVATRTGAPTWLRPQPVPPLRTRKDNKRYFKEAFGEDRDGILLIIAETTVDSGRRPSD